MTTHQTVYPQLLRTVKVLADADKAVARRVAATVVENGAIVFKKEGYAKKTRRKDRRFKRKD